MLDSKAKRAKQKINPADKQKQPDNLLNVTNSSVHVSVIENNYMYATPYKKLVQKLIFKIKD
uniref:Uncharacterized protein n=1 Tax=Megaselia scalaris TaxID=36166 RepID=T1GAP8_MEGSC